MCLANLMCLKMISVDLLEEEDMVTDLMIVVVDQDMGVATTTARADTVVAMAIVKRGDMVEDVVTVTMALASTVTPLLVTIATLEAVGKAVGVVVVVVVITTRGMLLDPGLPLRLLTRSLLAVLKSTQAGLTMIAPMTGTRVVE